MGDKVRLAVLSLSGCDGCEYDLVDEKVIEFLQRNGIEVAHWPVAGMHDEEGKFDVTIVQGSVVSNRDHEMLKSFRARSKVLVAMGSCAVIGGIQSAVDKYEDPIRFAHETSKAAREVVNVDYYIRGCPPTIEEIVLVFKKILEKHYFKQGEKKFALIERNAFNIDSPVINLDGSKCIVCGRCIEVCRKIGVKALDYFKRGIDSAISTPYKEPFDKSCIMCGLCASYCPVGALTYRMDLENILTKIRNGTLSVAYIEPEALAALSEAEDIDAGYIITALKYLGFSKVVVYTPLYDLKDGKNKIFAYSPAEYSLLKKLRSDIKVETLQPSIPLNGVYITQCAAWKNVSFNVLTAREVQLMLRKIDYEVLEAAKADELRIKKPEIHECIGLGQLNAALNMNAERIVFKLCPGGCLLGSGQPISKRQRLSEIREERAKILENFK